MEQVASIHHWAGDGQLKDFYHIVLKRDHVKDTVTLEFHSRIHVTRVSKPTFCWSCSFTDSQILRDRHLVTWLIQRYGIEIWR